MWLFNKKTELELQLEARNEKGVYLWSVRGKFAEMVVGHLGILPEFIKTTKKIEGKGEIVIYKCIHSNGADYLVGGAFGIHLSKDSYVKIEMVEAS